MDASDRHRDHARPESEIYNTLTPMPEPLVRPTASFLNYTPVPLAFGTSGLRGLVKDITDLEAYINVKAALRYLLSIGDIRTNSTVVIAGDLRPSTDRIMRACTQDAIGARPEVAGNNHRAVRTDVADAKQIAQRSFDIDIGLKVGDVFDQSAQPAGAKGQRHRRVVEKQSFWFCSRFGHRN